MRILLMHTRDTLNYTLLRKKGELHINLWIPPIQLLNTALCTWHPPCKYDLIQIEFPVGLEFRETKGSKNISKKHIGSTKAVIC